MSEIKASGEEYYKSVKEEEKNEKRHIPRFIQKIVAWGFFIGIWTAIYLIVYGVVLVLLEDNDINLFTSFHAGILILVFLSCFFFAAQLCGALSLPLLCPPEKGWFQTQNGIN